MTGLSDARRLLEDIPNKIISGLGIVAAVILHETRQGSYLEIEVEAQAFPVSYKGQYYVRAGATNQLLSGTALDTFLLRKQGQSWDAAPVPDVKPDDLSSEAIRRFAERARGKGRVPDEALAEEPGTLVRHLRLDRDGYLTNAAVLLFHPEPDRFVPGCTVKIGFFEEAEILYQDEVSGPIVEQADKTIDLLYSKYLKAQISYDGIRRVERYPFPLSAVREAVVNAIVHKNYPSGRADPDTRLRQPPRRGELVHPARGLERGRPAGTAPLRAAQSQDSQRLLPRRAHRKLGQRRAEDLQRLQARRHRGSRFPHGGQQPQRGVRGSERPSGGCGIAQGERCRSGMERTDSSRKRTDSIEEHDDSDAERADSSETSRNDNGGFNATTLQNIEELRRSLSDADQFGRHEVIESIGGSDSRAGKLLKKMLEAGIIEQVKGHGKGRYRFKRTRTQKSGEEESGGR